MRHLKGCSILCSGILLTGILSAQPQRKKDEYYPYWHQRVTHFRLLPNEKNEVIFLGDSITDGCNWSEIFQDGRIKNRGISGDVTEGVLERLTEVVESGPLKVFLMIGINDLADGKTGKQIVDNIKKIVKYIIKESPKTEIYLQSILPVNGDFGLFNNYTNKTEDILSVNRVLKRMAGEFGITFVDLHSLFSLKDHKLNPEYTNDGMHLTGKGYLVWKSAVEEYIGSPPQDN
jgi:lysophospholipase L1-like esterase